MDNSVDIEESRAIGLGAWLLSIGQEERIRQTFGLSNCIAVISLTEIRIKRRNKFMGEVRRRWLPLWIKWVSSTCGSTKVMCLVGSCLDRFELGREIWLEIQIWESEIYRLWLSSKNEGDCLERTSRVCSDKHWHLRYGCVLCICGGVSLKEINAVNKQVERPWGMCSSKGQKDTGISRRIMSTINSAKEDQGG